MENGEVFWDGAILVFIRIDSFFFDHTKYRWTYANLQCGLISHVCYGYLINIPINEERNVKITVAPKHCRIHFLQHLPWPQLFDWDRQTRHMGFPCPSNLDNAPLWKVWIRQFRPLLLVHERQFWDRVLKDMECKGKSYYGLLPYSKKEVVKCFH